jgi:phospholipase/lecithinase/hemolysin
VGWQVDQYLGAHTPHASDLFVLSGGQNNFSNGETDPAVPVGYMIDHITALANAGGLNFVVANILPIGKVPAFQFAPPEDAAWFSQIASDFNLLLASELDDLRQALSINIILVDWYSLVETMIAEPASYGFTNVSDPAFNGAGVVANPNEYLFWDYLHPTSKGHGVLAGAAADAVLQSISTATWIVPEPSTSMSLGCGVIALVGLTRWRRRRRD